MLKFIYRPLVCTIENSEKVAGASPSLTELSWSLISQPAFRAGFVVWGDFLTLGIYAFPQWKQIFATGFAASQASACGNGCRL